MDDAKLFVNYRRRDASGSAGRLHADLERRFGRGQVFRDVSMRPGVDFVDEITKAAGSCHALLAVIGPRWAGISEADGRRRLDDPEDYVRMEIETALRRDDVTVIPVLVEDAAMPSRAELPPSLAELSRLHACRLSDPSWDHDVAQLIGVLEPVLDGGPDPRDEPVERDVDDEDDEEEQGTRVDEPSWGTAARVAALSLLAGPLALALSAGLANRPEPGGANTQADLVLARERVVYYALERAVIWAVIGAVVLVAWTIAERGGAGAVAAGLGGALAGAAGGLVGGALYQGVKYLANDARANPVELHDGVLLRGISYAIPVALIGWAFAGSSGSLKRREGLAAGALAGVIAAAVTNMDLAGWRGLSLAVEALIAGGALGGAAIAVARSRARAATTGRIAVPA